LHWHHNCIADYQDYLLDEFVPLALVYIKGYKYDYISSSLPRRSGHRWSCWSEQDDDMTVKCLQKRSNLVDDVFGRDVVGGLNEIDLKHELDKQNSIDTYLTSTDVQFVLRFDWYDRQTVLSLVAVAAAAEEEDFVLVYRNISSSNHLIS
jgi:hypothetical protein